MTKPKGKEGMGEGKIHEQPGRLEVALAREGEIRSLKTEISELAQAKGVRQLEQVHQEVQEEDKDRLARLESALGPLSVESQSLIQQHGAKDAAELAGMQQRRLQEVTDKKDRLVLEAVLDRILSYRSPEMKLVSKRNTAEKDVRTFELNGQRQIELVGVTHSSDSDSPTVKNVESVLSDFLEQVPPHEAVLMVEGLRWGPEGKTGPFSQAELADILKGTATQAEAVRKFGEKGVLLWKAKELGLSILSPEKPEREIVTTLREQGKRPEDIALYLTLRQFTSSIGGEKAGSPEDARLSFARAFYEIQTIAGVDWIKDHADLPQQFQEAAKAANTEELKRLANQILETFSSSINNEFKKLPGMEAKSLIPTVDALLNKDREVIPLPDVNGFHDPSDGEGRGSIVNEISMLWNQERDKHLVRVIQDTLKHKKRPFVVFGASHTTAIKPAVEELVRWE